jgi:hypothetical protein
MNAWVSGPAQAPQLALVSCPWPGRAISRLSGKNSCAPAQFRGCSIGSWAPLNASTGTVDTVSCTSPTAAADFGINGADVLIPQSVLQVCLVGEAAALAGQRGGRDARPGLVAQERVEQRRLAGHRR